MLNRGEARPPLVLSANHMRALQKGHSTSMRPSECRSVGTLRMSRAMFTIPSLVSDSVSIAVAETVLKISSVSCSTILIDLWGLCWLDILCGFSGQSLWLRREWPVCPQLRHVGAESDVNVNSDSDVAIRSEFIRAGFSGQSLWLRRECPSCPQLLQVMMNVFLLFSSLVLVCAVCGKESFNGTCIHRGKGGRVTVAVSQTEMCCSSAFDFRVAASLLRLLGQGEQVVMWFTMVSLSAVRD